MNTCSYCGLTTDEGCSNCGIISCPDFEPLEGFPTDENFWQNKRWLFDPKHLKNIDPLLACMSPKEPYYDF